MDDRHVLGLGEIRILDVHQLQDLALGDHGRGRRQDIQNLERAVLDHDLKGAAEQEVTDQDAGLVAPHGVGRGVAAAQVALVDDVVVEQRRRMDEFDAGCQIDVADARIAAHARAGQRDQGPQAFAAGGDDVSGEFGDQRHAAVHARQDHLVDLCEILAHEGFQCIERLP